MKDTVKKMAEVATCLDKIGRHEYAMRIDKIAEAVSDYIMSKKAQTTDSMLDSYLTTALWSSNDEDGRPLDDVYNINDFSIEDRQKAQAECDAFVQQAGNLLDGLDMSQVGHDFWLTRNGHGAGFWDGDYPEGIGERLTEIAKGFGSSDVYVGEDNKVYLA